MSYSLFYQGIDMGVVARAPLSEIADALARENADPVIQQSFRDVVRSLAVELISGIVPYGMLPADAFRRGRKMLLLLNSNTA